MVSASGDASLRLIYGGDVQPVDQSKIPDFKNFRPGMFQEVAPGQHSRREALRRLGAVGPEHAALQHEEGQAGADGLGVDLQPEVQGRGHRAYDNLDPNRGRSRSTWKPGEAESSARITDPYEADARPSSTRRSSCSSSKEAADQEVLGPRFEDEIDLVQERRRRDRRPRGRHPDLNPLQAAGAPVKDTIPKEGATGWFSTPGWSSSHLRRTSRAATSGSPGHLDPEAVQAEQAIYFGETPVNSKEPARGMDKLSEGLVRQVPRERAAGPTSKKISFWKTPLSRKMPTTARTTAFRTPSGNRPGRS